MSLVELMVAMVIGLILTSATFAIYLENRSTTRTAEILNRMQENARLAIELIGRDIKMAGHYGAVLDTNWIQGITGSEEPLADISGDCAPGWYVDLTVPVWATDDNNAYPACIDNHAAGTDILVTRYASAMHVGSSLTPAAINAPTVNLLDSGQRAEIDNFVLLRASPLAGVLFTDADNPPGNLAGNVEDRQIFARAYFVRSYFQAPEDNLPALVMKNLERFGAAPQLRTHPLIPGVEQFQVQLGIDSDGDGAVNFYRNPETSSTPVDIESSSIRAVRIWLLMRAEEKEVDIHDTTTYILGAKEYVPSEPNYRRQLFTATFALRNRME